MQSEQLLKNGLAMVYRQGGAQYGDSIDKWNYLEETAKLQKKVIHTYKYTVCNIFKNFYFSSNLQGIMEKGSKEREITS